MIASPSGPCCQAEQVAEAPSHPLTNSLVTKALIDDGDKKPGMKLAATGVEFFEGPSLDAAGPHSSPSRTGTVRQARARKSSSQRGC